MVGQEHIIKYIDNKTRDTFPRSLILLGETGCGKRTVIAYIKDKLKLEVINISDNLNLEFIENLYSKPEPYIYVIDAPKITIKEQNIILKFVEEPLKNSYIIIIAETKNQLLQTVYNRCQVLSFNPYSREQLQQFTSDELVLKIAKTPGQINNLLASDLKGMLELAEKIVRKIGNANLPNVLTISDKIAYKNEKDKFDLDIFSRILLYTVKQEIICNNTDPRYLAMYDLVREWLLKKKAPTISQKFLFENYLVKLHELMRG